MKEQFVSVIVPAAGAATRMGGEKQRLLLKGMPVLAHTLTVLQKTPLVKEIVVVARPQDVEEFLAYKERYAIEKLVAVVPGGLTRQQSVQKGLQAISPAATLVAIHDGARPLVTVEEVTRVIQAAEACGGATAAAPVKDTIKQADENGFVSFTPNRRSLWAAHTPQVFCRERYEEAMAQAIQSGQEFTDDCQLFEHKGYAVQLVHTGHQNIKITTPEDMLVASGFFNGKDKDMRIGHGYDVHRLVEGRSLILGGVTIPYEKGLLGHSDADVLTHAIMDALLGAAGLRDIGYWFPDTDERYRGADSLQLLCHVIALLHKHGYAVGNVDATVVAQAPKLRPFIDTMRRNVAKACCVSEEQVNIKATTEEKLGFTGSGEGIAAQAVCLLMRERE